MFVSLYDLFWIQSSIPCDVRERFRTIFNAERNEPLKKTLRDVLTYQRGFTQLALIVLTIEMAVEIPEKKEIILDSAESLLVAPRLYGKLLRDFYHRLALARKKNVSSSFSKSFFTATKLFEEKEESFYF